MADLKDWLRSFFCRHEWETYETGGYTIEDERVHIQVGRRTIRQCVKCGRVARRALIEQEKQRG